MKERMIAGLVLLFLGCTPEEPYREEISYTVRPGDTLWRIAQDLGVRNYDKWHYEVCQRNEIPLGGLLFPGDDLVLYKEGEAG